MKIFRDNPVSGQRGAASIAIAIVILLIMTAALMTSQTLTGSAVQDAAASDLRVQALFLAESGLERTSQRFVARTAACGALQETGIVVSTIGTFSISAGTRTLFDGITSSGTNCLVRIRGTTTAGKVTRVIEALLTPATVGTASKGTTPNFTCIAPPSDNLLASVSVSWTLTAKTPIESIVAVTAVKVDGLLGVAVAPPTVYTVTNGGAKPYTTISAQNWYVTGVKPGASLNGQITFGPVSGGGTPSLIVACIVLAGVDQSNPIDTFASASGVSSITQQPTVSIKPGVENAVVIDNLAREKGGNLNMPTTFADRTEMWNLTGPNGGGAGSLRGPFPAPTPSTPAAIMDWTWNQNSAWALTAVSIQGTTVGGTRAKVRLPGGGVLSWREVTVTPLP